MRTAGEAGKLLVQVSGAPVYPGEVRILVVVVVFALLELSFLFILSGAQANAEQAFWFRIVMAHQKIDPICTHFK